MPIVRPRILLVEDEESIRFLLASLLAARGYDILQASNGAEGVQLTFSEAPDAVITDLVMPEMDGFAYLARVRSRIAPQRLPVVVISALGLEEHIVRAFEAGATDYLIKPFRCEDLLARIQVALRRLEPGVVDTLEAPRPAEPSPPLKGGSLVDMGKYRILAEIGSGGMGRIFRAVHVGYGHEVALKVMDPERAAGREDAFRFLREVRLSIQMDHANIVRVYDMGIAAGSYYYAMESLPGPSLEDEVEAKGALPEARLVEIGVQLASALAYMHERRVVHRDVKPSNVLFAGAGTVKLTDFGLAVQLEDPRVTRIGMFVGTPGYVAPEAIQAARELDPRFDIYGLGTTLYFCATGKEAFPDRAGEQAQLRAQVLDTPEEPRARNPGISNELSRIIMKMMARDPANRYPRAREAVADLRKLQPVGGKDRGR